MAPTQSSHRSPRHWLADKRAGWLFHKAGNINAWHTNIYNSLAIKMQTKTGIRYHISPAS